MAYWKIFCMEGDYPGLWQRWFQEQCVAVGWAPGNGYHLRGDTNGEYNWPRGRATLERIQEKDKIVVHLRGRRIGRIGEIVKKEVEDADWKPLVPESASLPYGEMGRRIQVRWDLTIGPSNPDKVVQLPEETQLGSDVLRPTLCELEKKTFEILQNEMRQEDRWVGLLSHFAYERSLSDYIAAYPHRLEDGLRPYPSREVREKVFADGSRSDVLLVDRTNVPVVVECKQGTPIRDHVRQLTGYLKKLRTEAPQQPKPRGILVHGGARKLPDEVRIEIKNSGFDIDVLQYELNVGFSVSR